MTAHTGIGKPHSASGVADVVPEVKNVILMRENVSIPNEIYSFHNVSITFTDGLQRQPV